MLGLPCEGGPVLVVSVARRLAGSTFGGGGGINSVRSYAGTIVRRSVEALLGQHFEQERAQRDAPLGAVQLDLHVDVRGDVSEQAQLALLVLGGGGGGGGSLAPRFAA